MNEQSIQEVAGSLFAAPGWFVVEGLTIEQEGKPPVEVLPEELETFEYPSGKFTIRIETRTTVLG